ncbi:CehA/McbA family metallohydrolase [Paenibacillus mendelii]|uniref:CehA/McbA family metallohydrolase n=1 Tax=Paenibacillus mendelii TaxID=206163 RepID=A0ABV6JL26_9BACL|nr:CehA/McbA family metallohydrolase [Paenibacillus mendelii]MCQ6562358.1 CehA/McbA family metallohydrolase [Paenibacillus mendelii]
MMLEGSLKTDRPSSVLFNVEDPADWLTFTFEYEGEGGWRTFTLRDPSGRVRFTHLNCNNSRSAVIHRNYEDTSFLGVPGEIEAGEWEIKFVDQEGSPPACTFTFEWKSGIGDIPPDRRIPPSKRNYWTEVMEGVENYKLDTYDWHECRDETARWYKGDFHTHTVLSDGKMTPERNMEQAEIMGLDFFVATDHNLISTSWPQGRVLVIPGVEYTSGSGHWNALGVRQWYNWTYNAPDGGIGTGEGMNRLLAEVGQGGGLRSINHPMLTPWAWVYEDTLLENVDCMEIWNDPTYSTNPAATERALVLWSTLWNEGWRLPGIGGSDSHMLPTETYSDGSPPSLIGDPGTYVYAERLSPAAILAAVQAGRVYVSRGPVLDVKVIVGEEEYPLGSDLTEAVAASVDGEVDIRLAVTGAAQGRLHIITNGTETSVQDIPEEDSAFAFKLQWRAAEYEWVRAEIRTAGGELLAFTNPVYHGQKNTTIRTWGELLKKASFDVPVN